MLIEKNIYVCDDFDFNLDSCVKEMNLFLKRRKITDLQYMIPNEGHYYVTSLPHFNYYEAELLIEHSSLTQSVSLVNYIYNFLENIKM